MARAASAMPVTRLLTEILDRPLKPTTHGEIASHSPARRESPSIPWAAVLEPARSYLSRISMRSGCCSRPAGRIMTHAPFRLSYGTDLNPYTRHKPLKSTKHDKFDPGGDFPCNRRLGRESRLACLPEFSSSLTMGWSRPEVRTPEKHSRRVRHVRRRRIARTMSRKASRMSSRTFQWISSHRIQCGDMISCSTVQRGVPKPGEAPPVRLMPGGTPPSAITWGRAAPHHLTYSRSRRHRPRGRSKRPTRRTSP